MPVERSDRSHAVAFRGALWITLIALITTASALTVQYLQTTRLLEAQMRGLLDDEASSLVERYQAGGVVELAAFLKRQQELPRLNQFFYLLAGPNGTFLAGNLSAWPEEVDRTGFHRFRTIVAGAGGEARPRWIETRALLLDGRYPLLVGQFAEERTALREQYLAALFWSLLLTGALGLLLGWWYSRRALAFLETVSRTGERFLSGDLSQRVPVSGRGDEYDRLAATINACFREIEHVVRSLRAATDGMAHDLKTPLTRISARLQLAELRSASPEELRQAIGESRNDLESLLRIIEQILNLARTEATTMAAFVEVDVAAIARDAIELYEPVAEDRGVRLEARLEAATIRGAPALLSQLLVNLIDNAIKYSDAGGVVTVEVERRAGRVVLTVGDNGPGIPAERREEALSRFVRLEESRGQPGSGLGLSIAGAVARVHRADLELSDNHPGLRVTVRLPTSATLLPTDAEPAAS
jgi:signal transduction histidine kinase